MLVVVVEVVVVAMIFAVVVESGREWSGLVWSG